MSSLHFIFSGRSGSTGGSGLTGAADFDDLPNPVPDPAPAPGATGLRSRLGIVRRALVDTAVGLARVLRLVWRANPRLTVALGVATVLIGLVPALTAATSRVLINAVVSGIGQRFEPTPIPLDLRLPLASLSLPPMVPTTAIVLLAIAQFAIYQVNSMSVAARGGTQQLLQERVAQVIRGRIMAHAARLDLAFYEGSRSYDLLRQAQQEAAVRPVTIVNGAFGLIQAAITFLSMIALLVAVAPWLALVAVLAPIPAFISDARYGTRAFLLSTLASPARRRMEYLSNLVTTDSYAKEVAVFGLGPYFTRRFELLGNAYYRRLRRLVISRHGAGAAWSSLSTLVGSVTYLYLALSTVRGELTLGDLILYTAAVMSLQTSIQGIFQGFSAVHENNLYLGNLFDLLATPAAIRRPEHPVPLPARPSGEIFFEDVSFRYPGTEQYALRGVTVRIPAGEVVAVVGHNGSGKSTLVKLLCRLYDPCEGRILLDGVDLRELDPDELRRHVAAMFQDYVRYQATAAENIGLGDVAAVEDRTRVTDAAQRAGAGELIAGLPDGMDTMLGKWFGHGTELSGGQWQKIALARAFMRDTALLVLDEPTAALDARAEAEVFDRLAALCAGRTAVYVSHRFSTVRRADRILVFDGGRLIEQGRHEDLVAVPGGVYAELFALQAAPFLSPLGDTNPLGDPESGGSASGEEPIGAGQPR